MTVEEKLHSLGLALPLPSVPADVYRRTRRVGNLVYVAGRTPNIDSRLQPEYVGVVGRDINGAKLQDDFRRDAWRHGCGKEDRFSFTACGRRGRGEQYEKKSPSACAKGLFRILVDVVAYRQLRASMSSLESRRSRSSMMSRRSCSLPTPLT